MTAEDAKRNVEWARKVHISEVTSLIKENSLMGIDFIVIPNDCETEQDENIYKVIYSLLGYDVLINDKGIIISWYAENDKEI